MRKHLFWIVSMGAAAVLLACAAHAADSVTLENATITLKGDITVEGLSLPVADAAKPAEAAPVCTAAAPCCAAAAETKEPAEGDNNYMLLLVFTFTVAIFLGVELITKVPSQLHTPLMSGSNAISGISIVGALIASSVAHNWLATAIGFVAVICGSINVFGGYVVTDRMLSMFKAKKVEGK